MQYILGRRKTDPAALLIAVGVIQSDTKKWELLKNPTKIEEIQGKKNIDRN